MSINIGKCVFGQPKIEFLGYEVSSEGICPLQDKVKAIEEYPKPETVEQLRRFLGMLNFYRSHIPNAAQAQGILDVYLQGSKKKDLRKIEWTTEADLAFQSCKDSLKNAVTLSHPMINTSLALMTDASDFSIGAVLQQKENNTWKPLGFFSKKLNDCQKKYCTYDKELLAIYAGIVYFRDFIEGRSLTVYTDHKPLTYAFSKIGTSNELPRRIRQLSYVSEYTSDIRHIEGKNNQVADALSRIETITCPSQMQFEEIAQAQRNDAELANLLSTSSSNTIQLKRVTMPNTNSTIYCESSNKNIRPYIPIEFRKSVFDNIHGLSHSGIRSSRALITKKFFWPGMNKDIGTWVKTCIGCQKSKIARHTVSKYEKYEEADRFTHLHVDIIGKLPVTEQGFQYCVTMIDRRTRWPEICPIKDITAESVAKAVYETWICRFGCPNKITTDQGRQFESELFTDLMKLLGIHKTRTTPYHPQCNGKIERWHRTLKTALTAKLTNNFAWVTEIHTVMLGLRAACISDSDFMSAAEMTLGHCLRLPGEFHKDTKNSIDNSQSFIIKLRDTLKKFRPKTRNWDSNSTFVHRDLESCSHVFLRIDAVRKPLTPPYSGPHKVLERGPKVFKLVINGKEQCVSIDRLKPAYLLECLSDLTQDNNTTYDNVNTPLIKTTRSGRVIRKPVRFIM